MKAVLIASAALLLFVLAEAQSGAHANNPSAPAFFDQVRRFNEGTSSHPQAHSLRIATWNIDRGTELEQISHAMSRNPADLFLLQEVDWSTARAKERDVTAQLAQELHCNAAFGIEFEELGQERGHPAYTGQATLTSLPMRSCRVLRFDRQSGFWKPRSWMPSGLPLMQRRVGSRIALVSELAFDGHLLVVYNAHLESRSAGMIQAEQIDEVLRDSQRYPPGTAFIVGGDLNTKYLASISCTS